MIRIWPYPVCVYCGQRIGKHGRRTNPPTCACHRDLPQVDPQYAADVKPLDQWADAR